ncbi:hypothetical protein B7486_58950, partial [cyanobacterium TDX16]
VVGVPGTIGAPRPDDGSGWAQPGPDEEPPPGASSPPVAAVQVDASGCTTWLMGVVMVVVMAGVGFWWGQRRHGIDPDEVPATLYVGAGLAVLCLVLALVRVLRDRADSEVVGPPLAATALGNGWKGALLPWHWTPGRLVAFGLANVALAVGVAVGFQ